MNQHEITPHAIYALEFSDIVCHSKINLGLLREEAEDLHTIRTFEIPACGGFQLAPRNHEILSFFEENKEIVCFGSLEELKEKINYYLHHEKERAKIADNGYQRCLKGNHTYRDRVVQILDIMVKEESYLKRSGT